MSKWFSFRFSVEISKGLIHINFARHSSYKTSSYHLGVTPISFGFPWMIPHIYISMLLYSEYLRWNVNLYCYEYCNTMMKWRHYVWDWLFTYTLIRMYLSAMKWTFSLYTGYKTLLCLDICYTFLKDNVWICDEKLYLKLLCNFALNFPLNSNLSLLFFIAKIR